MAELGRVTVYSFALRQSEICRPDRGLPLDRKRLTGGRDADVSRSSERCAAIQLHLLRFRVYSLDRRNVHIIALNALTKTNRGRVIFAHQEKRDLVFDEQLIADYRRHAAVKLSAPNAVGDAGRSFDLSTGPWLLVREGETDSDDRWGVLLQVTGQPAAGPAPAGTCPTDERSTGRKLFLRDGPASTSSELDALNRQSSIAKPFPEPGNRRHRQDVLKYLGDQRNPTTWNPLMFDRRLLFAYRYQNIINGHAHAVAIIAAEAELAILGRTSGTAKTLHSIELYLRNKIWPDQDSNAQDLANYLIHYKDLTAADVGVAQERARSHRLKRRAD